MVGVRVQPVYIYGKWLQIQWTFYSVINASCKLMLQCCTPFLSWFCGSELWEESSAVKVLCPAASLIHQDSPTVCSVCEEHGGSCPNKWSACSGAAVEGGHQGAKH